MRILLAHNSTYYPAQGGGDKSNRLLMEALASRGHEVTVVARTAGHGPEAHRQLLADLAERDIAAFVETPGVVRFCLRGVNVHVSTGSPNLRAYFTGQIQTLTPDVIVASTDDSAQILLRAALDSPALVVYLARATIALPFGPDAAFPSEERTAPLRAVDGMIGVSQYVATYIREHSGIAAIHLPISLMDGGPWQQLGRFDNEFVTHINPCLVKGIDILTGVAEAMPHVRFAAVRSWGTTETDLARLRALANITVLDPVDDIDIVFRRTRVLLVPSIWAEARARVVQEAMLRGIPVIASDTGGLSEAKLGVPYLLPVNQLTGYKGGMDAQMVPAADAPPQDLRPWIEALERLTADPKHWQQIAENSRTAALEYARQLTAEPFESFLLQRIASKQQRGTAKQATQGITLEQKKQLALKMLARRIAAPEWLVRMEGDPGPVQLICFPYAATGTKVFRNWPGVLAVRYPGREGLHPGQPILTPEEMLQALMENVAPKLKGRFAFFGHSMGAGLAFELTRRLESSGAPMPEALFVSSARGPRLRTTIAPDPTDEQLLDSLERMNPGRDRKVLETVLPLFRADSGLYRSYVYAPGNLLHIPIRAYGGTLDHGVRPEHLELWREETTGPFSLRLFEGGHLYLEQQGPQLLEDIREQFR